MYPVMISAEPPGGDGGDDDGGGGDGYYYYYCRLRRDSYRGSNGVRVG